MWVVRDDHLVCRRGPVTTTKDQTRLNAYPALASVRLLLLIWPEKGASLEFVEGLTEFGL
jgi:hypothetical protein